VNSRVPKTRKPKVSSPKIPTGVGNNCVVGPREERLEVWELGVEEGSKCENLRGPKTPKPETPKFRNPEIFEGHKNC
jgi:hypothetical protein